MLSAPRISPRLLDEIERLSRRRMPIAELNRRVGAAAARLGLPRPSYEQVRLLVHEARSLRPRPATASLVEDVLAYPHRQRLDRLTERLLEPPPRLRDRADPGK